MRNVVVCCLDTVRKDYFDRFASRLAARADTRFENCRAASGWSVPSHASMLTGSLPHEHGVHAGSPEFGALDPQNTFLGDLPEHRSVGVSANVYASSAFGFDALFDEFVDVSRDRRYPDGLDLSRFLDHHPDPDPGLGRYADCLRAITTHDHPVRSAGNAAWLAIDEFAREGPLRLPTPVDDGGRTLSKTLCARVRRGSEPVVAFANLMEAHEPHRDTLGYDRRSYAGTVPRGWSSRGLETWDVMEDFEAHATSVERYRALYGASIEYLDRLVSDLIDRLLDATDRETTVIVTADHGENLALPADEGSFGHVTSLSEGVLHVPLVLVNPPAGYPERVPGITSHLSLRRLIAGLARGEMPSIATRGGRPERAVAEVIGATPSNDPLVERDPDRWDRLVRCAYDGSRKHVWDSRGDYVEYALDFDRLCWQRRVEDEAAGSTGTATSATVAAANANASTTPPAWATEYFTAGAADYRRSVDARDKGRADGSVARVESIDPSVSRRLAELGYR